MITLQEQITTLEKAIDELKELQWNVDNYEAFLASLKELQEIKEQEPVGWFKYDKVSMCYHPQYEQYAERCAVREKWSQLYALPVAIPEGMMLVPIEPTEEILNVMYEYCKFDSDDEFLKEAYNKIIKNSLKGE